MSSSEMLVRTLAAQGLLPADAPAFEQRMMDRPWFVSLVLGLAGWLAGLFAMIFVAMLFEPNTAGGYAAAGLVLLGAAFGLYAVDRESAFFDQLALAFSIAGQLAIMAAAFELTNSAAGTAAFVAIMQGVLLVVMPNRLAKAIAAFFACIAWALAVRFAWWGEWSFDRADREVALLPALLGWFVIWIPLIVLAYILVEREASWIASRLQHIARPALGGVLLSLALGTWVSEPLGTLSIWGPAAARTNWLAIWPLLAAATALYAALCAFRLRHRALLGVAIAGALLHVVQFYLVLGTSLLTKSCIMLIVGALLLLAAFHINRRTESAS
jgi:hypothetical protein